MKRNIFRFIPPGLAMVAGILLSSTAEEQWAKAISLVVSVLIALGLLVIAVLPPRG